MGDRIAAAWEALRECRLCPRACGVDRTTGQKGYCGLGARSRCFREMIFDAEEEGLNPSHQVYFAGCNLRCGFCSVAEWNEQPEAAKETDVAELSQAILRRRAEGAQTLNLLGGEPAVSIYGILEILAHMPGNTRVIWNSNMYYEPIVARLLDGLIDVWLPDVKCGNDACASRLLGADNYLAVVQRNIMQVVGTGEVIARHVVMPGHLECCTWPILRWLGELDGIKVSLRHNYVPPAEDGESPSSYLTEEDVEKSLEFARQANVVLVK